MQPGRHPQQQHHQHSYGHNESDGGKRQDDSHPAEAGLLQPNRFLLVAEGFAVALPMMPLEVAKFMAGLGLKVYDMGLVMLGG